MYFELGGGRLGNGSDISQADRQLHHWVRTVSRPTRRSAEITRSGLRRTSGRAFAPLPHENGVKNGTNSLKSKTAQIIESQIDSPGINFCTLRFEHLFKFGVPGSLVHDAL